MDYYKPSYNVLKVAGSSSGYRHSIDTIKKLKELLVLKKKKKIKSPQIWYRYFP
jgi:hypothetical protein